jgi:hypothetical protein
MDGENGFELLHYGFLSQSENRREKYDGHLCQELNDIFKMNPSEI